MTSVAGNSHEVSANPNVSQSDLHEKRAIIGDYYWTLVKVSA